MENNQNNQNNDQQEQVQNENKKGFMGWLKFIGSRALYVAAGVGGTLLVQKIKNRNKNAA